MFHLYKVLFCKYDKYASWFVYIMNRVVQNTYLIWKSKLKSKIQTWKITEFFSQNESAPTKLNDTRKWTNQTPTKTDFCSWHITVNRSKSIQLVSEPNLILLEVYLKSKGIRPKSTEPKPFQNKTRCNSESIITRPIHNWIYCKLELIITWLCKELNWKIPKSSRIWTGIWPKIHDLN